MDSVYNTFRPDGFGTVSPYLFAGDPDALINFLKKAFAAEEIERSTDPESGKLTNCILKIGYSCIMLTQASGQFQKSHISFYLYVNDVDEMYRRAMEHGAESLYEPADMPYQDRQAGIVDPEGNYWWISKRLVEKGYHE